jgi:F0F1-type ATP synthase assembly protein I
VKPPTDDRAPLARAYDRATRGITVAIGMVVPGLVGYYLDDRLGTRALLTIVGFAVGVAYGVWQLLRLTNGPRGDGPRDSVLRSGGDERCSKTLQQDVEW